MYIIIQMFHFTKYLFILFVLFVSFCRCHSQLSNVNSVISGYKTRITQNKGSISGNDLAAITSFVTAAKKHHYWDKLIDVGPLAGNNI
ncbi:hypothetical protein, partial [Bradyrhizobium sp. NBAIM08]|uniref:hypothetical protein n=1 Tax=Bradyrhizobium sp. NBAIM08 TaxID=2793815 RepID=UPI001CD51EE9